MWFIGAILLCVAVTGSPVIIVAAVTQEIPFKLRDGVVWIKATSPASTNLLLDSAAQLSVMTSSTATRLGISGGRSVPPWGGELEDRRPCPVLHGRPRTLSD